MPSINLSDLLDRARQNEALIEFIPELGQLRNVVEIQGWHAHQNVYDHSIQTLESIDALLTSRLPDAIREHAAGYLGQPIGIHTRGDLLRLAALLHDIGKIVSLQHNAAGETLSPSHGTIGAWAAKPVVARFSLTKIEQTYVLGLIADHLIPSDLIEMAINNRTPTQAVTGLLLEHRKDTAFELLLIAYADWLGCDVMPQLETIRDQRIAVANKCLELVPLDK
jgi:poly(A) polymerase